MGQGFKKTSMQDIADYLGISKNAVSLAINNKDGVSEGLRLRVIRAAEELKYSGYSTDNEANKDSIIIATANYITVENRFYYDIIWGIEKESRNKGINTIITSIDPQMESKLELPNLIYRPDIAGVILLGVIRKEYVEAVIKTGMAVVLVDNCFDDIISDAVVTANVEAAYCAVKYLIEMGHKKIGYIGSKDYTASNFMRWVGYNKKMNEDNLVVNTQYCFTKSEGVSYTQEELRLFVESLKEYPTAWFCVNDYIAVYLINVLRSMNIRVPEDISIIGFDDVEIASIIDPKLTTVKVQRDVISKKSVELLLNEKLRDNKNDRIKVMAFGELVIRDSVKKL